ncbi:SIMPL domain-containing protein [Oceanicaulis sp. UBA6590]|uniref:SIMPL domain-containing protein n=1 Tax=Oceanicaulis sp. UBA6590 TaxID=1947008 RepID=UPI0025F56A1D|nr:SIMPL domain-containing protein [Oceanicaulis sp. UBA6590]|tara:strand:+ start:45 stop:800 length:756 start_codon:yes stop_codon:yes gene_type:complete
MKRLILPALLLASPLLAACEPETPRTVTVTAEGWAVEPAHYAVVEVHLGARAETQAEALEQAQALFTTLNSQLPRLEGMESFALSTQELDIQQDCPRGQNRNIYRGAPCEAEGYVVTQRITITMSPAALAGNMASLANELGAADASIYDFLAGDAESVDRRALQDALANAQHSANALAEASGLELGDIISIQPAYGRVDVNRRRVDEETITVTAQMRAPVQELDISPSDIRAGSEITVVFELVDPVPASND